MKIMRDSTWEREKQLIQSEAYKRAIDKLWRTPSDAPPPPSFTGVDIREYYEEVYNGRFRRSITPREVAIFNLDLKSVATPYAHPCIIHAFEECRDVIFSCARSVMHINRQPYGGMTALGDEICLRGIGAASILTTESFPSTKNQELVKDRIKNNSALVVIGFLGQGQPPIPYSTWQGTNAGKRYPYQSLIFSSHRAYLPFAKCAVPIIIFPGDDFRLAVALTANPQHPLQPVGVAISTSTNFREENGSVYQ